MDTLEISDSMGGIGCLEQNISGNEQATAIEGRIRNRHAQTVLLQYLVKMGLGTTSYMVFMGKLKQRPIPVLVEFSAVMVDIIAKDGVSMPGDGRSMLLVGIGICKTLIKMIGFYSSICHHVRRGFVPLISGKAMNGVGGIKKVTDLGQSHKDGLKTMVKVGKRCYNLVLNGRSVGYKN
jgi:hypothetical protein